MSYRLINWFVGVPMLPGSPRGDRETGGRCRRHPMYHSASKDMQSITERIEETKQKAKDGSASMRQQMEIESLNQTLHKEQISTMKEREQAMKVPLWRMSYRLINWFVGVPMLPGSPRGDRETGGRCRRHPMYHSV
eukprot:gene11100-19965_t